MNTYIRTLAAATAFLTLSSFGTTTPHFIGTFGVPGMDPANISLTLNKDHTFTYYERSKKINVSGNWEQKGKKVILKDHNAAHAIPLKWKFSKNGQIARSRKALCWYTIGKL